MTLTDYSYLAETFRSSADPTRSMSARQLNALLGYAEMARNYELSRRVREARDRVQQRAAEAAAQEAAEEKIFVALAYELDHASGTAGGGYYSDLIARAARAAGVSELDARVTIGVVARRA